MQEKEELTNLITETSLQNKEMNSSHEKKSKDNVENKTLKINAKLPKQTIKNSTKTGLDAKKTTKSSQTKTANTEKTSTSKTNKTTNSTNSSKTENVISQNSEKTKNLQSKVENSQKAKTSTKTKTATKTTDSENSQKEKVSQTTTSSKAKANTSQTKTQTKRTNSTSQPKKNTQQKNSTDTLKKEKISTGKDDFEKEINSVETQELNLDEETKQNPVNETVLVDNKDSEIQIDQTENTTSEDQKSEQQPSDELQENQIHENHRPHIIEIITGSSIFKYFLSAMIVFGICFVTSLFTFNIMLVPTEVQGYSMLPTINISAIGEEGDEHNDIVYVSKFKKISHSDIIVIESGKTSSGNRIIKRVIALPGDTITFKVTETRYEHFQNYFYVDIYLNGEKLEENYTKEEQTKIVNNKESSSFYQFNNTLVSALDKDGEFSLTLGNDEYFVMGDNRNIYSSSDSRDHGSVDSRMFGTVKKDEIVGNVVFIVEYGNNLLQAILKSLFAVRLQIF